MSKFGGGVVSSRTGRAPVLLTTPGPVLSSFLGCGGSWLCSEMFVVSPGGRFAWLSAAVASGHPPVSLYGSVSFGRSDGAMSLLCTAVAAIGSVLGRFCCVRCLFRGVSRWDGWYRSVFRRQVFRVFVPSRGFFFVTCGRCFAKGAYAEVETGSDVCALCFAVAVPWVRVWVVVEECFWVGVV